MIFWLEIRTSSCIYIFAIKYHKKWQNRSNLLVRITRHGRWPVSPSLSHLPHPLASSSMSVGRTWLALSLSQNFIVLHLLQGESRWEGNACKDQSTPDSSSYLKIFLWKIFVQKNISPTSSSSSASSRDLLGEPDPEGELDVDFLDNRRSLKSLGEHLNKVW